jgi:hypothetical protein
MSVDEFEYNKNLLKEIVTTKRDIADSISKTQHHITQARNNYNSTATYEVYKL